MKKLILVFGLTLCIGLNGEYGRCAPTTSPSVGISLGVVGGISVVVLLIFTGPYTVGATALGTMSTFGIERLPEEYQKTYSKIITDSYRGGGETIDTLANLYDMNTSNLEERRNLISDTIIEVVEQKGDSGYEFSDSNSKDIHRALIERSSSNTSAAQIVSNAF